MMIDAEANMRQQKGNKQRKKKKKYVEMGKAI